MKVVFPKGTKLTINGIEGEILENLHFETYFTSEVELAENLSAARLLHVTDLSDRYGAGGKLLLETPKVEPEIKKPAKQSKAVVKKKK